MSNGLPELESQITDVILRGLKDSSIDIGRAKVIAEHILISLKEGMNEYELYQAVKNLEQYFPEINQTVLIAGRNYEDFIKDAVIQGASVLLKSGDTDQARMLLTTAVKKEQEIKVNG